MTAQELDEWGADFFAFCARLMMCLAARSPCAGGEVPAGAVGAGARKNGWQLAEAMGDTVPDPTQRLLYRTLWSADSARNILQKYIVEVFADEDGIGVVDETGFIKKGIRSVGVNGSTAARRQDRELPDRHISELCHHQRARVPGPPAVSARRVVPRRRAAGASQSAGGRELPDQARAGHGYAGTGLAGRRAHALGGG